MKKLGTFSYIPIIGMLVGASRPSMSAARKRVRRKAAERSEEGVVMQNFISVPFKSEKHHGLSEVSGVAKFSVAGVVLEFESKLFGLISDGVKEARIPTSEILDVRFKKGVFKRGAKIEIRTKSLAAMAGIPNDDGKVTLKIKAEDFDRAREAAATLQDATTQLQDYRTEKAAALPPTHTPVSVLFDESEDETQELVQKHDR